MCDFGRSRLIAWLDDELGVAEAAAVKAHVEGCEECAREVRSIRRISGDLAEYARALAAPGRSKWRWAPVAAAAAVLFAAGIELTDVRAPEPPANFADPRVIQVAVPLEDLLPIGAAPPGAVIVGEVVLDVGGTPRSFRLEERDEPQGD